MDALFIICPPFWTKLPPLGLAYLFGNLNKQIKAEVFDFNTDVFNTVATDMKSGWERIDNDLLIKKLVKYMLDNGFIENLLQRIKNKKYSYICFSMFSLNRAITLFISKIIKNKFPNIKIIIGGPEVKYIFLRGENTETLNKEYGIDFLVAGAAEDKINKIITSDITNRAFDELDFPDFSPFDLSKYIRKRALPIMAARGCIKKCEFCVERLLFNDFEMRSAENIFAEIKKHYEKYKTIWFTFHDSLLNARKDILLQLCKLLIAADFNIKWEAQIAIMSGWEKDDFSLLKKAGCFNLFIGLESGSDKVLSLMRKGYNIKTAISFFKALKEAKLHFETSFIVAYPGENEKDFKETLDFLYYNKKYIPKIAQVNRFIKLPGTSIERNMCSIQEAERRMHIFKEFLKKNDFIYTKEFIGNLR